MSENDESEINIIYDINGKNDINIFGSHFVNNNKEICKMVINNNEYKISENFNIKSNNNNKLEIKLKGIDKVIDMSYMLKECSLLLSLPDISKWNTKNVTGMESIFF